MPGLDNRLRHKLCQARILQFGNQVVGSAALLNPSAVLKPVFSSHITRGMTAKWPQRQHEREETCAPSTVADRMAYRLR